MKHFYLKVMLFFMVSCPTLSAQITRVDPTGISSIDHLYSSSFGLLFRANQTTTGIELYITDGTMTGTTLVKDIDTNNNTSSRHGLLSVPEWTELNGKVYFSARSNVNNAELWVTDGSNSGTELVKEIAPSLNSGSDPGYLTILNNTLYFSATTGAEGRELWKSDGTETGTQLVTDIYTGAFSATPSFITVFNNSLYFMANDGTNGFEPWLSDGTSAGTLLLRDIANGSTPSSAQKFTEFNGELFFSASGELYKTNGNAGNATLVRNINATGPSNPDYLTAYNNKLYFSANNGTNGNELWSSNGATFGTLQFLDINPNGDSNPRELLVVNGLLFFTASNNNAERNLWVTDGTSAGTIELTVPGVQRLNPTFLTEYNGKVYFYGYDASQSTNTRLLYTSDGTASGTQLVSGSPTTTLNTEKEMVVHNNELYLISVGGNNLYKYRDPLLSVSDTNILTLKMYPNPTNSHFKLDGIQTFDSMEIFDVSGKLVKQFSTAQENYAIFDLDNGLYLVKINSDKNIQTLKLIKK